MPNFDYILKQLNEVLESLETNTTFNEETLSEKIMTKKQAKRKRNLQRKRRAERKAAKQAELKAQQEQPKENPNDTNSDNVIEGEIIELSDEDIEEITKEIKNDEDDKQLPAPTNAVILLNSKDSSDEYQPSDAWQTIYPKIQELCRKYIEQITNADKAWEALGKDKPITQEVWDLYNKAITEFTEGAKQIINDTDVEQLTDEEVVMFDRFMEAVDGYTNKIGEMILAIKPNLTEDDFKAPAETGSTEVANPEEKEDEKLALPNKSTKDNTKPAVDKKTVKTLLKAKDFQKKIEDFNSAFEEICDSLDNWADVVKTILAYPASFIADKTFAFLTSPLATDIVKTFMYANPITAMIFDGKFGNLGFGTLLDKAKSKTKEVLQKAKGNPDNFDKRGFPKNINNMTLKEIRKTITTPAFVDLVNISYNHPDVNKDYKGQIKNRITELKNAIKIKDIKKARQWLTSLIETLNLVCDSMDWKSPADWAVFGYIVGKIKGYGTTNAEEKEIDKKAAKDDGKVEKSRTSVLEKDLKQVMLELGHANEPINLSNITNKLKGDEYETKAYTDEEINKMFVKVKKALDDKHKQKQESYNLHKINIKLQKLLEMAEA